jgi:hypothetical protein
MNMKILWAVIFGLTIGLATNGGGVAGEEGTDFEAEQKQIEKEDAEQKAERAKGVKGKYQRAFYGTVYLNVRVSGEISPDVVGVFLTSKRDLRPGRTYQMKLRQESKALRETIKKLDRKSAKLTGKLRLIGANGVAKYVIVNSIEEVGLTQRVPERRSASGL